MSLSASSSLFAWRSSQPRILQTDPRVERVLRTIQCDPLRDVATLARMVNLSSSRLSHLFKLETGRSLQAFIVERRLEKAAELLRRRPTPVKEVSYTVGYSHPSSFVRAFRKKFGRSPTEYRKEAQNSAKR